MGGWRSPLFLLLVGCVEYEVHNVERRDSWEQVRRQHAELLFVVDNSQSMLDEQASLGESFDVMLQGLVDADVSWRISVTTTETLVSDFRGKLEGHRDALVLRDGAGEELERLEWDREWVWVAGVSMALDGTLQRSSDPEDWCQAEPSPGAWNLPCSDGAADPPEPGVDDGPRAPAPGDLAITEVLALSTGLDSECEWFELANLSDDTLQLDLVLTDHSQRAAALVGTLAPAQVARVGRSDACGFTPDLLADFSLADGTTTITQDTPDAGDRFREAVAVGVESYGLEMGLQASLLVFQEPYYSQLNGGFLDGGSSTMTVVYVSDEDDMSPESVSAYARDLGSLKGDAGFRQPDRVRAVAIVGTPDCGRDGVRYRALVDALGGSVGSICEDFSGVLAEIGLTASGLHTEFELSALPSLESLSVELYKTPDAPPEPLFVGEDFELELRPRGDEHVLVLVFPDDSPPPSESSLTASYSLLPPGTDPLVAFAELLP